jgi:hypothetical protein
MVDETVLELWRQTLTIASRAIDVYERRLEFEMRRDVRIAAERERAMELKENMPAKVAKGPRPKLSNRAVVAIARRRN